jgi:hypothetical protein
MYLASLHIGRKVNIPIDRQLITVTVFEMSGIHIGLLWIDRRMWDVSRVQKLRYFINQGLVAKNKRTMLMHTESFYEECARTFVFKLISNGKFLYEGHFRYFGKLSF